MFSCVSDSRFCSLRLCTRIAHLATAHRAQISPPPSTHPASLFCFYASVSLSYFSDSLLDNLNSPSPSGRYVSSSLSKPFAGSSQEQRGGVSSSTPVPGSSENERSRSPFFRHCLFLLSTLTRFALLSSLHLYLDFSVANEAHVHCHTRTRVNWSR